MDVDRAYAECARVARREARNFYFAFLSLPRRQRRAVYALYAFCREADDVADSLNPLTPRPGDVAREGPPESALGQRCEADPVADSASPLTPRPGSVAREVSPESALGQRCEGDSVADSENPLAPRPGSVSGAESPELREGKANCTDCVMDSVASPAGAPAEKREGLREMRARLGAAAEGRPRTFRDAALADAIERYAVRPEDLDDVITGVEMDLDPVRLTTEEQLDDYCYHVASAVGLATLPILNDGIAPTDEMRELAVRLGLGMQRVNILRDVAEDLDHGRLYLPLSAFARHRLDPEILRERTMSEPLRGLLREFGEQARADLAAAGELARRVPRGSRSCLWLLAEIYGRILSRIEASDYEIFAGRASLPTGEKLRLLLRASVRRR